MKKYLISLSVILCPGLAMAACPTGYISIRDDNFAWASVCEAANLRNYGDIQPCSANSYFCLGINNKCIIIDALYEGGAKTLIDCDDTAGSFDTWFTNATCPTGDCHDAADTSGDDVVSYDEVTAYADALCAANTKSDAATYMAVDCDFLIDGDYSSFVCQSGEYIGYNNTCQPCPTNVDIYGQAVSASPGTGDITTCYIPSGYSFIDADGNTYMLTDSCDYQLFIADKPVVGI